MFERCLYFNANALARKLNTLWETAFARYDLAPSHGYLLRLVLAEPGLHQQAIAAELRLDKSTVARFITQLEKKDLLVRQPSSKDQRGNIILPTKTALALQGELEALGAELYTTVCQTLGKENMARFVTDIREVTEKL